MTFSRLTGPPHILAAFRTQELNFTRPLAGFPYTLTDQLLIMTQEVDFTRPLAGNPPDILTGQLNMAQELNSRAVAAASPARAP